MKDSTRWTIFCTAITLAGLSMLGLGLLDLTSGHDTLSIIVHFGSGLLSIVAAALGTLNFRQARQTEAHQPVRL